MSTQTARRPEADLDRTDPGAVISAMYAMISGPAGPRDWALNDLIFHPDSRQIRTSIDAHGAPYLTIMSSAEYRANTSAFFESSGFYEIELDRRLDVFGNMAQAWSAYEARINLDDPLPERRGINSIQLNRDEHGHWRIISMIWDNERAGVTIAPF